MFMVLTFWFTVINILLTVSLKSVFLLQVRRQMQKKLSDLEPVPELLKLTEHKLQDCQQQLAMYEKKNVDQSSIICDLRMEVWKFCLCRFLC